MAETKVQTVKKPVDTVESMAEGLAATFKPVLQFGKDSYERVSSQFSTSDGLVQLGVLAISLLIAIFIARRYIRKLVIRLWPTVERRKRLSESLYQAVLRTLYASSFVLCLWIGIAILQSAGIDVDLLRLISSIATAWIFITLVSTIILDPILRQIITIFAWVVAVLHILRLLNPTIAYLDSVRISIGSAHISVYGIIKGAALLVALIWLAIQFGKFIHARVGNSKNLSPSVQSLISQTVSITAVFIAVMIALNAIGVDLTAFAVFSGAVGVGIGFGLQAIFSNLISGVIMHLEGSIRVGDFVDLESGITGEVKEINTRATLITTNDNIDILVPNSQFINSRVTNWTLRQKFRRLRVPFGVAYGTDKDLVKKAVLEGANDVPHDLQGPDARPSDVWLVGFGDSSLNFELVVWLNDAAVKRPGKVRADYNWAIESALGKYGIEIPFPQRDIHIRSGTLPIENVKSGEAKS